MFGALEEKGRYIVYQYYCRLLQCHKSQEYEHTKKECRAKESVSLFEVLRETPIRPVPIENNRKPSASAKLDWFLCRHNKLNDGMS